MYLHNNIHKSTITKSAGSIMKVVPAQSEYQLAKALSTYFKSSKARVLKCVAQVHWRHVRLHFCLSLMMHNLDAK